MTNDEWLARNVMGWTEIWADPEYKDRRVWSQDGIVRASMRWSPSVSRDSLHEVLVKVREDGLMWKVNEELFGSRYNIRGEAQEGQVIFADPADWCRAIRKVYERDG